MAWTRSHLKLVAGVLSGVFVVCALTGLVLTYRPEIREIERPQPSSFASDVVARGEMLVGIGDCIVCHTSHGGAPYAGGKALATPFGVLFSTNITPDEKTGIGRWSLDAFRRAMRDGVARDGSFLYPAFPYEHYTHLTDPDIEAIYAFLMTRRAVDSPAQTNRLIPPLGFRPLLAGWNLLFLHKGVWQPDPKLANDLNRGSYLVEALAHCGACHTPRNIAGGEERGRAFAGGVAEGWNAPALDRSNPAARPWTADEIFTYLRTGIDMNHSVAAGPMGPVTTNLANAPADDVRAIAAYVASLMTRPAPDKTAPIDRPEQAAQAHPEGAVLFAGACAGCHGPGAPMMGQGRPPLSLASPVREADPRNAIQIILQGVRPDQGVAGPVMPSLGSTFTDAQVAELVAYVRARYSDLPAWPKLEAAVAKARKEGAIP
ncbi:MAG: cytochrome c [Tardiphaga sp.]